MNIFLILDFTTIVPAKGDHQGKVICVGKIMHQLPRYLLIFVGLNFTLGVFPRRKQHINRDSWGISLLDMFFLLPVECMNYP